MCRWIGLCCFLLQMPVWTHCGLLESIALRHVSLGADRMSGLGLLLVLKYSVTVAVEAHTRQDLKSQCTTASLPTHSPWLRYARPLLDLQLGAAQTSTHARQRHDLCHFLRHFSGGDFQSKCVAAPVLSSQPPSDGRSFSITDRVVYESRPWCWGPLVHSIYDKNWIHSFVPSLVYWTDYS